MTVEDEPRPPKSLVVWLVALGAITLWLGNLALPVLWIPELPEKIGLFGDMFGAVNALFSGLAFVGVVYAIVQQRYEIKLARYELQTSQRIFDQQSAELAAQNEQTKRQVFENTFFQMLSLLTSITNSIRLRSPAGEADTVGKNAFPLFIRELKARFREEHGNPAQTFDAGYDNFYQSYKSHLGHYYRTVYNILKFVDRSDIADKRFYTNILRAQLSDSEAALLLHNAISQYGAEKFRPLAIRYELFKNAVDADLVSAQIRGLLSIRDGAAAGAGPLPSDP